MTIKELRKRVAIIVSQAKPDQSMYKIHVPIRRLESEEFIANPGEAELSNDQLDLLKIVYAECRDARSKLLFVNCLFSVLGFSTAQLIGHIVIEIGSLDKLRNLLTVVPGRLGVTLGLWTAFAEKLTYESHKFSETDLDFLEETNKIAVEILAKSGDNSSSLQSLMSCLARAKSKIQRVQYLRLRKELFEGQNPEINTDKQTLVSRLEALGFRKEIVGALEEMDRKLIEAGKPLDFKGCMDLLRTVYEEIVEDAAKTTATKKAKVVPQYGKPFQPWCQYLETEAIITQDEGALAQKLYNYLSNAGSHRLGSQPEQVRVTRNFVIELGLLIVGRVQEIT